MKVWTILSRPTETQQICTHLRTLDRTGDTAKVSLTIGCWQSTMNAGPPVLRIGTRASPLALWQAEHVAAQLRALYPERLVEIRPMTTTGDRELASPLHQLGGKGLFVKEIEMALLAGEVDLAVHSMKDVPARQPAGLEVAVILAREDVRDAFVSRHYAHPRDLPPDAVVGSSSLRRRAQLLHRFPSLRVEDLRGNVATRLARLDAGTFDGILLAAAGLHRLGLQDRIAALLPVEESLPAVGQGAIGIEIRVDDDSTRTLVAALADAKSTRCVLAERAMNGTLGGDCRLPVAALAVLVGERIHLRGRVASIDGRQLLQAEAKGNDPLTVGQEVASQLLAQGAARIIEELKAT